MESKGFAVRIGQEEMGRILNLKETVDHTELLQRYVTRYQRLGWVLVGLVAGREDDAGLDFNQGPEVWSPRLSELAMAEVPVNVGVRTGKASQLLVLEVNRGEGALALDQLGEWRAACIAEVGGCREQHYYALPADGPCPPSFFQASQALVYGEGGLVMAPPSLEPQAHIPWRWLQPPWERSLHYPQPAVWQFLRAHLPAGQVGPEVFSWEEIYRVVSPYSAMLKAMLLPAVSSEEYYLGLLNTALRLGLTDSKLLLGLLWHAPHGEARHRPEKWDYLQELVAKAQQFPGGDRAGRRPETPAVIATLGKWLFSERALNDPGLPPAVKKLPFAAPGASTLPLPGSREAEPSPGRFDQSVSGQFFQLLAGLGEKVITESCRDKAIRSGRVTTAADAKYWQEEWDRRYCPPAAAAAEPEERLVEGCETDAGEISRFWATALQPQVQHQQQLEELQAAAHDFLGDNPDLAADRQKVLMVLFCLKNYVAINPDLAGLSFREKLEKAVQMARVFLWEQAE